jgi:hypothetical protein
LAALVVVAVLTAARLDSPVVLAQQLQLHLP